MKKTGLATLIFASIASAAAAATPVIMITDIGSDIDDSWAIALALRSPELELRMVVTDPADTEYRAVVAAKLLQDSGHGDVPIAIGDNSGPMGDNAKTLTPWIAGYDLSKYPGHVYKDGVKALIDSVRASPVPVTIVAIGPVHSLALALARAPDIAQKCRFVGMYGSFDVGYGGGAPSAETNVRVAPAALRQVLAAPWKDVLLTPLDTCGSVSLAGERYHAIWSATADPLLRSLIQSYCIFAPRQNWMNCDFFATRSTTLFDCVAVYLAYSEDLVRTESIRFDVTDDGYTRRSPTGALHARVAIGWRNKDGFEAQLAGRLLSP
ncbi:MAG TPA: nucleoside hydrolase [Opitutaceae bacterium]|jgi:inosine-uridine nucleoside N-ribohydrolase